MTDLRVELGQEVKVLLQVSGQDGLDDQETEAFELHVVQVGQEVELGLGQVQTPGRGGVVVLQDRAVVVQHRLESDGEEEDKREEDTRWRSGREEKEGFVLQ